MKKKKTKAKEFWRGALPYLIILCAVYYAPPIAACIAPDALGTLPMDLRALTFLYPMACLGGCAICTRQEGPNWLLPVAFAALFLPTVPLFYRPAAIQVAPELLLFGFGGMFMGILTRKMDRLVKSSSDSDSDSDSFFPF